MSRSASADLFGRLERAAAGEDREAREQLLLLRSRAGRSSTRSSRAASAGGDRRRDRPSRRSRRWRAARGSVQAESAFARAAASSTASGQVVEPRAELGDLLGRLRACARSQKRATASGCGERRYRVLDLALTRRSSRLVTSSVRLGQAARSDESSGAASITCSRLSSRSSISRSPMCSARPSFAPSVWEIVSVTSAGSRSEASPTQKTPALYSGTSVAAASSASRVLPEPPGPVSVTSRAPPRSRRAPRRARARARRTSSRDAAGSCSRSSSAAGSSPRRAGRSRPRSAMSFSRCSPRSRERVARRRARAVVGRERRPGRRGRPRRPARRGGRRRRRSPPRSASGVPVCRPTRTWIGPGGERLGHAPPPRPAPRRGREGEEERVALRVDLDPAWRAQASRIRRRCSASASAYASAPSSCSSSSSPRRP